MNTNCHATIKTYKDTDRAFCIRFVHICVFFWKTTGMDRMEQYHWKLWARCICIQWLKCDKRNTFQKWWNIMRRGYVMWYKIWNIHCVWWAQEQTAVTEQLVGDWTGFKCESDGSEGEVNCLVVDVLLNVWANVEECVLNSCFNVWNLYKGSVSEPQPEHQDLTSMRLYPSSVKISISIAFNDLVRIWWTWMLTGCAGC